MNVGLFIPCYVDQLFPHVGMATVEVLEKHGIEVDFPEAQTCCGQPMANTGCTEDARPLAVLGYVLEDQQGDQEALAPAPAAVEDEVVALGYRRGPLLERGELDGGRHGSGSSLTGLARSACSSSIRS